MINTQTPPLSFLLIFLFFSLMFLSNTYKLWFKTEAYYQDVHNSLTRTPIPFKEFFLRRLENRKRWEIEQKIFSVIGFVAVIGADLFLIIGFWGGK
jgi:hypothetical protein